MNLFKGIAISIGWLTGSLAGIGAILYACGYLIITAQLHLLGLDGLFRYSNERYIQEGGTFFIVLGQHVGEIFLNLLITVALPILVILVVMFFFKRTKLLGKINEKWPWLWRILAFSLLLFFLYRSADPQSFNDPLEISNLLYINTSDPEAEGTVGKITSLLLKGETETLKEFFSDCLLFELKAGVLLLLAWYVTSTWRLRILWVSPFIIIFMLYTIFLPMLYGVLDYQMRFPAITLSLNNEMLANKSGNLFLLNKAEDEFILWDPTEKKVLWIPKGEVKTAEIEQMKLLFEKSPKE